MELCGLCGLLCPLSYFFLMDEEASQPPSEILFPVVTFLLAPVIHTTTHYLSLKHSDWTSAIAIRSRKSTTRSGRSLRCSTCPRPGERARALFRGRVRGGEGFSNP